MGTQIQSTIPTQQTPVIKLLFDDGTETEIPVLSLVRGVRHKLKRPSGFYFEPNQPTYGITREQFMRWIHEEFIHIFDRDVFDTHLSILTYKEN